jgi:hypothetical protein
MMVILGFEDDETGYQVAQTFLAAVQDHKTVAYPYTDDDGKIKFRRAKVMIVYRTE